MPLTMPSTRLIGSPRKLSRSGRIRGMPPHTAASNNKSMPDLSAAANNSAPCVAISALFAVTTGLPEASAFKIKARASSMPPINSTTKSTVGSLTTKSASCVSTSAANEPACAAVFRTATRAISNRTPLRAAMVSDCCFTSFTKAAPTVPCPITPMRTTCAVIPSRYWRLCHIQADQVLISLASDNQPSLTIAHKHNRWARHFVVVRTHRMAVRTRHWGCKQVANL